MKTPPLCTGALLLGAVLAAGWISTRVDSEAYAGGRARDEEELVRRNSSALATMLGEFRTGISDIMFIKTERYLHAGVGYIPHMEVLSAEALAEEVDEHQSELGIPDEDPHHGHHHHGDAHHGHHHHGLDIDHEHAGTPTLIPPAHRDFRGFVGRLHREVKPWRDPDRPHVHTDGRELLPWFRVMTLSDPKYVRGYVAGGFWLQMENTELALAFVEEGLRNNPEEFQLYVSRGFLRIKEARKLGDPNAEDLDPAVREVLELALGDFLRGAELMAGVRPDDVDEDGFGSGGWGRYQETDALAAAGMSVSLTRNLGDPEGAREIARRYIDLFPDFRTLRNALETED